MFAGQLGLEKNVINWVEVKEPRFAEQA